MDKKGKCRKKEKSYTHNTRGVEYFIDCLFFAIKEHSVRTMGVRQPHTVLPISREGFQKILHERFPEKFDGVNEGKKNGGGQRLRMYCSYFNRGIHNLGYAPKYVAIGEERICEGDEDLFTPKEAVEMAYGRASAKLTPEASDISEPNRDKPDRVAVNVYRILRDTALARRVKNMHDFECQICGHTITLQDGSSYAEAHHIKPLGSPHNGPDSIDNILCLCPNHHVELDYGIAAISLKELRKVSGHKINLKCVKYHNQKIRKVK